MIGRYFTCLLLLIALLLPVCLKGEGTPQLIPSGAASDCRSYIQGNDGTGKEGPTLGRPSTDFIHVHISDPDTETIYYGFTKKEPSSSEVYYWILAPDSSVVCHGRVAQSASDSGYVDDNGVEAYVGPTQIGGATGYDALECKPTVAGDYMILFNVGSTTTPSSSPRYYIHPFDVTVADVSNPASPTAITGRLFSYKWHLNTTGSSKKACMEFFTWTPADSLVMMMDMNEIQPYGYTVSFNSFGASNTGDIASDRQSSNSISDAVPEYRVFLSEPDSTVYPTGTPGEIEYIDVSGCEAEGSFCIEVEATRVGEVNVYIDLNGVSGYDEGTADRYFPYEITSPGQTCIPWDGLDGNGAVVAAGTEGSITVEFLAGIVHYPVYDPENHTQGFNCSMIRPTGFTPLLYYDNRNTSIATYDLDGCSSGCNTWSSNKGDKVMVNTWINTITSTDTDSFFVSGLCPPNAGADSACTNQETSRTLLILSNDNDSDNSLDSSSVEFISLSDSGASLIYTASLGAFQFDPSEEDSINVEISYKVCDKTPDSLGGALCDTSLIYIQVNGNCQEVAVLNDSRWDIRPRRREGDVMLDWSFLSSVMPMYYVVERKAPGDFVFSPVDTVRGGSETGFYRDRGVVHTGWDKIRYRVRAVVRPDMARISRPAGITLPGQKGISAHVGHSGRGGKSCQLRLLSPHPLRLEVSDMLGRQRYARKLKGDTRMQNIRMPSEEWEPGWYVVTLWDKDWRRWQQRIRIE